MMEISERIIFMVYSFGCVKGIRFSCIKGRFHNEEQNKKDVAKKSRDSVQNPNLPPKSRKKKTRKAVKKGNDNNDDDEEEDETCKVKFTVYWCEQLERWFVPHQQAGFLRHCGHMHIVAFFDFVLKLVIVELVAALMPYY